MPKVNDLRYREFLDKGVIELFSMDELDKALLKASNSKFGNLGRAYLICQYYMGARPVEILQLKARHFEKKGNYLRIQVPTAKRGVARVVSIPFSKKHVTELYKYATSIFDDVYVFYDLVSHKTRTYINKKGVTKRYIVITDKVYYYIKKWVGITPYFLRHSRLSSLSQNGANPEELRQFKGCKRYDSVMPYLHMSRKVSESIGRKLT